MELKIWSVSQSNSVHFTQCFFNTVSVSEKEKIVIMLLQDAHVKWFQIGRKLNMPIIRLYAIQAQHEDAPLACFTAVLTEHFQGNPNISALIEVLSSTEVDLQDAAIKLQGNASKFNNIIYNQMFIYLDYFLQCFFDSIIMDVYCNIQIDDNMIDKVSAALKDDCLKEKVRACKGLGNQTRWLGLSSSWSSFDYEVIKVLIEISNNKKLKEKMKRYKKKFKESTVEFFASCFKIDNFELMSSEKVLTIKINPAGKKMKSIKKEICKNIKNVLHVKSLRLQKLQKIEDCYSLTFGTSFHDLNPQLNQLKGTDIMKLSQCITEIILGNSCIYGFSHGMYMKYCRHVN